MSITAPLMGFRRYWHPGEVNAFSGLFINLLVNVLTITILASGVVHIPIGSVTGTILPALGIELLVGNCFYFWLAKRLAQKEGRDDVTAMPYGPSVPHMFIVTLVIMLPTYLKTHSFLKAWEAGLAWAFIIGVIILIGAFVGPYVRRVTPRAAMLGALAGISLTFIAMQPAAEMWDATWIALPVLIVIIAGFVAGIRLPRKIPIGLAALVLGTAIGWIGGYMHPTEVSTAAKDIAVGLPSLNLDLLGHGLSAISPLLATAIPLGVYNFCEAMTNVESAAAAGDSYNLRHVLLADGTGAIVGACLGSPFPPAVYIGQPGWKEAGGRLSYSLACGVAIFVLCIIGMFPLLAAVLPIPAIVPVLLYIGLVIGAQAFAVVPRAHYPAVVLAMIPNIAAWGSGQVNDALSAAGTSAGHVGEANLVNAGVHYNGLLALGNGATLAGLVLGGIAVFLIDRRFYHAAAFCAFGALLSVVGLIHGAAVHIFTDGKIGLGYALAGITCLAFVLLKLPERQPDPSDPMDIEAAAEAGRAPSILSTPSPLLPTPAPSGEPEPVGV
jgi:AGZA family xanthine/uracil permease-like MFS transporter